jgi:hypothetical protein
MPIFIPPRTQNPLFVSFVDYVRQAQEQRRIDDAKAKESGAALSASGAAGGAAAGAALGLALAPFTGGLSAVAALPGVAVTTGLSGTAGALIGGAAGAGIGALTGGPRIKPGKGPNAQPGNIAQDNALIAQGITNTVSALAKSFKKAKDDEGRGQYIDALLGTTANLPSLQRQQAVDQFVSEIPKDQGDLVRGYTDLKLGGSQQPGPGQEGSKLAGGTAPGQLPTPTAPTAGAGFGPFAAGDPRARGVRGAPAGQQRQQAPVGGQQAAPQQQARQPQTRLKKTPKEDVETIDKSVERFANDDDLSPAQKAGAINVLTKRRQRITKNRNNYEKIPSIRDIEFVNDVASGQTRFLDGDTPKTARMYPPEAKSVSAMTAPELKQHIQDRTVPHPKTGEPQVWSEKQERYIPLYGDEDGGDAESEFNKSWDAAFKRLDAQRGQGIAAGTVDQLSSITPEDIEREIDRDKKARRTAFLRSQSNQPIPQLAVAPTPLPAGEIDEVTEFLKRFDAAGGKATPDERTQTTQEAERLIAKLAERYKDKAAPPYVVDQVRRLYETIHR